MKSNLNQNTLIVKGIKNRSNKDVTYAHAILLSIAHLDCAKVFLEQSNKEEVRKNDKFALTRELYNLFDVLNNYKEGYSELLLEKYANGKLKNAQLKEQAAIEEPFFFLFFLLYFLHDENKLPPNMNCSYLNKNTLQDHQNDDEMYFSYMEFLNKTQKSMIYEYFHSTEKYTFRCQNCGEYYDYGTNYIIKINLDNVRKLRDSAFPELANQVLTIEECLQYYAGGHLVSCKYCGNPSIYKYTEFCHPAKVIIFSISRNNNTNNVLDFDFDYQLDISSYFSKRANDYNTIPIYSLKACITRGIASPQNIPYQKEIYIADCYVKDMNMDISAWYKFCDEQAIYIGDNYCPQNAPIMLIYEVDKSYNEKKTNNKDNLFNDMNSNAYNPNMYNNFQNNNNINLNNDMNNNMNYNNIDMNNNMNYNNNYMNNNIQYNTGPNMNNDIMNNNNMNNGNNNNYNMNNNNMNNINLNNNNEYMNIPNNNMPNIDNNNINMNNLYQNNNNIINMNNNNMNNYMNMNNNNNMNNNMNMLNMNNNNMNNNNMNNNNMNNNIMIQQNNNNQ